jgi:Na+-translocating ferredoxin:NAD+ oxidoreductase RnfC subunit
MFNMEDIITRVRDAGVVGAGGAGFPTHAKLASSAEIVVVNGAECEPLLRVDQQLMAYKTAEMIEGLEAVMTATGAKESRISLKPKYKEAAMALEKAIVGKPITIVMLDDFYPAGDEQVTVFAATGRLVPQGGIPIKVGCMVVNVETLVNIADALKGRPVTHTYLTVTGEVCRPMTCKLPVGMAVREALVIAGVQDMAGKAVIEGGPMMGKMINDLNQPITKTTKGLIVLPQDHPIITKRTMPVDKMIKQAKTACVQCRYCTDLCPRYLLGHSLQPHKIMRAIRHIDGNEEALKMALTCSECGVCEQYACLMQLSPRLVNTSIKQALAKQGIKPNPPPERQTNHIMQQHRRIPVKRLIARLGLTPYDRPAPLLITEESVIRQVAVKLRQHVGASGQPVVEAGQKVMQGQLIARIPDNALGANLHASISGVIQEINDTIVIAAAEGSGG